MGFKSTIAFAVGFAFTLILFSLTGIFILGQYEQMWGPGLSFYVSLGAILVGTAIVAAGFGGGLTTFQPDTKKLTAAIGGMGFALFSILLSWALAEVTPPTNTTRIGLILFLALGSFCVPALLKAIEPDDKMNLNRSRL